jgi:flagellar motility protein MotE (MotC chaperone)
MHKQVRSGKFGRAPALRLLPAVILAALCMLGFRVQVVVQSIADARTATVQVTPSVAFAQDVYELPEPAAGDEMAMDEDMGMADEGQELPTSFDPSSLTQSEIDTLERLAERREIIEKRERELAVKEGLLRAAEGRIDGKIVQLQDLERSIEGLLAEYDVKKQGEIEQLVRIYGAMKPKDAARIFDSLEMPILVLVVQSMKETKVAPILAAMNSAKATALTEELSSRRQISSADPA